MFGKSESGRPGAIMGAKGGRTEEWEREQEEEKNGVTSQEGNVREAD